MDSNNLKVEMKKKLYYRKILENYKNIFCVNDINMVNDDDFHDVKLNSVISLLHPSTFSSFYINPSNIISLETNTDSYKSFDKLKNIIMSEIDSEEIFVFHGSNAEEGSQSFYIGLDIKDFLQSFYDFISELETLFSALLINKNKDKFVYFFPNKSTTKLYVYVGEIIENKYINLKR